MALRRSGVRIPLGPPNKKPDRFPRQIVPKVFCKNLLRHADVPTADYRVFRDAKAAITYLKDRDDTPVDVKAFTLRGAGPGIETLSADLLMGHVDVQRCQLLDLVCI